VGGRLLPAGTRVVLWTEPNGLHAPPGSFGARRSTDPAADVHQIVLHYDVAGTSAQCFRVLERRGLSCHFLLDVDGTVYQTLDVADRAYHAGPYNEGSVGIEIANIGAYPDRDVLDRWYPDGRLHLPAGIARGALPPSFVGRPARPGPIRGAIHGRELYQQDFTDAQYEALARLCAALCRALPRVPPRAPAERGVLAAPDAWSGIVGHYHLTTRKVDPGPAFDWARLLAGVMARVGTAP